MNDREMSTRVLVVEDDGIIAKGIERRLTRMGYTVLGVAMSGEDAIQLAHETSPDIILMDINLGAGIDGIEAAERIRTHSEVPIIFLTAYSDDATISRAKEVGPYGYVLKPYDDKDLQTAIEIGMFRHNMQQRLRENEQWLAATLTSIGDGVIATDPDGKVRLINSLAEQLTGWRQEEALGRHVTEIFNIINEHSREIVVNPLLEVLSTKKSTVLAPDTLLVEKDGAIERPIEDSAAPIFDGDGALAGAVLVFRDITERRKLEELLRQTQKMESLGRLAGGIAHDFNNLLTVILASGELLLEDVLEAGPQRESLEAILEAGRRAATLTQQISTFSRMKLLNPRVLNLNESICDLSSMLQRLVGSNIEFHVDLESRSGAVRMDPAQLGQVLLNLIVNAKDAMPDGGTLTVKTEKVELSDPFFPAFPDMTSGPHMVIHVSDTGMGIASPDLERIFEPFFTTKEVGRGTGLGLSTVYGIMRQNDGGIEVSSKVGAGTTFRLYFREVDEEPVPIQEPSRPLPQGSETVLLIEDNKRVRQLTRSVLQNLGYTILEAANGRDGIALSATHEGTIDLLLTDLVMPGPNGRVTANTIIEQRPDIRVLFMSGYSEDVAIGQGLVASQIDLLHKPFTLDELATKVRSVIDAQ